MLRKAAAGLAGLGLIGGAGSVVYGHNGDATVRIKDSKTGQVQTVHIAGSGKSYSCPSGTHDKLEPHDLRAGRIKLTLHRVRTQEHALERRYPGGRAPARIVVRYKALNSRDGSLVAAFNSEIDAHNAIIDRDCSAAG
jgi:hypothetical protein